MMTQWFVKTLSVCLQSLMFRHDSNPVQMSADILCLAQPPSVGTAISTRKTHTSLKLSMKSGKSGKSVFTMPHPITEQALKTARGVSTLL